MLIIFASNVSLSSFSSSSLSSVFEDVKLMSARRVTFEMNMTPAHLPVLSSDLCLTVERKMKKNEEEKNWKIRYDSWSLAGLAS